MNEQDSDTEKGISTKIKKNTYMEDPEQDGSTTFWKNISTQEKDSSYIKWKTSETGDFCPLTHLKQKCC
jgi:hypothetical protein